MILLWQSKVPMSDLHIIRHIVARAMAADQIADIPAILAQWERLLQEFEKEGVRIGELDDLKVLQDKGFQNWTPEERKLVHELEFRVQYPLMRFPSRSFLRVKTLGVRDLFLGLLQEYVLPTAIRKKIEAAAKFYGKGKALDPKKDVAGDVYKKLTATYREHFLLAKSAITAGTHRSEPEAQSNWTAGPFKLINTGGFDDKTMTTVQEVVEKAVQLLNNKGLGKVCYGDMHISNTVGRSSSVLAFYVYGKDEMFIRGNLKGHQAHALSTVIHELAHRLQFKFLNSKKGAIDSLYRALSLGGDRERVKEILDNPSLKPQPGDTITSGRTTYVVDSVVYDTVHLLDQKDPKRKAKIPLLGYLEEKGLEPEIIDGGYVTRYAKTSPEENFAEMVQFYCRGRLGPKLTEKLEEILR